MPEAIHRISAKANSNNLFLIELSKEYLFMFKHNYSMNTELVLEFLTAIIARLAILPIPNSLSHLCAKSISKSPLIRSIGGLK